MQFFLLSLLYGPTEKWKAFAAPDKASSSVESRFLVLATLARLSGFKHGSLSAQIPIHNTSFRTIQSLASDIPVQASSRCVFAFEADLKRGPAARQRSQPQVKDGKLVATGGTGGCAFTLNTFLQSAICF